MRSEVNCRSQIELDFELRMVTLSIVVWYFAHVIEYIDIGIYNATF